MLSEPRPCGSLSKQHSSSNNILRRNHRDGTIYRFQAQSVSPGVSPPRHGWPDALRSAARDKRTRVHSCHHCWCPAAQTGSCCHQDAATRTPEHPHRSGGTRTCYSTPRHTLCHERGSTGKFKKEPRHVKIEQLDEDTSAVALSPVEDTRAGSFRR